MERVYRNTIILLTLLGIVVVGLYTAMGRSGDPHDLSISPKVDQRDNTVDADNNPALSWRYCSQEERIRHMHKLCSVASPSKAQQNRLFVDLKHELAICLVGKVCNTAIKAAMLKANGVDVNESSHGHALSVVHNVHADGVMSRQGIIAQSSHTPNNNTRGFMHAFITRHPLDRLLAYYTDKVLLQDEAVMASETSDVLKTNKTLSKMSQYELIRTRPSFSVFVTWLKERWRGDVHWTPIVDVCHPCSIDWTSWLRTETMTHDSPLLLHQLQLDMETLPVRHSHQTTPIRDHDRKSLPEYHDVPDDVMDFLLQTYSGDMEMYGYHWDRDSGTASCVIQTDNGPCC